MKKWIYFIPLIVGCLFSRDVWAQNDAVANAQHELLGMVNTGSENAKSNPDPRAAWFPKAGLGLFVHWGPIASFAGGDISWCMLANKGWNNDATITPNYYYSFMETWNPQKYDPDDIIRRAKEAGFEYAVLTTKHHDGYTLWPSKYGDLGTQTKMNGRDLVKPFIDACRKYGLKVGLYFSPPDWHFDRAYRNWSFNGKVFLDMNHQEVAIRPVYPEGHGDKRKELVSNQARELLTNYGKIDMFWFDGGKGEITNEEIRRLQPGIIINNRNGGRGDYNDSEGKLPTKRFNGWFETNKPCWPVRYWSYVTGTGFANASTVLSDIITLRAWGGNYLANVGPKGDGSIPPQAIEAWAEMAEWMKHSGESIKNTEGGNYPEQSTVPVTVKKGIVYAFAMPGYLGYINVVLNQQPKEIKLLRTGGKLAFKYEDGMAKIQLPPNLRTLLPDAMKITF